MQARDAANRYQVRAIHGTYPCTRILITLLDECTMGVTQIVVIRSTSVRAQIDLTQRDTLPPGVHSAARDICPARNQHRILKQIIRCTILLEDDYNVLDGGAKRWSIIAATILR